MDDSCSLDMLLLHIMKMINAQERYDYIVLDKKEKKNVDLIFTNNISSAHLLWLVHALEYFQ